MVASVEMFETTTKDNEEVQMLLDGLNLDCIKFKLMDVEDGPGWNREEAERVERLYKRFLFLSATSGRAIVPTKDIDTFWHQHILDTHKYAGDCKEAFGFFLHHFPYLGMRGEEDAKRLQASFDDTRTLYETMFGEPYGSEANDCENCGKCAQSCGVGSSASYDGDSLRPTLPPFSPSIA